MSNKYSMGDLIRVTGTFTDPLNSDAAIDPTAVNLSVRTPSGTTTTYVYGVDSEVVKSAVGVYYADVSLSEYGKWYYRWWSTGTGQAAEENSFHSQRPEAL